MTIGTGIGGGLILDGKLFHGASDVAGEIGHTTIDLNGRHCKCGNYGCLEAYASGPAIATRAREVLVREETASLLPSMVGGQLEAITARDGVRRGASRATPWRARSCATRRATSAPALRTCSTSSTPDVVVVAGGVTQAGDALFVPLRAEVRRRAFRPAVDAARIVPGELPGTAGVVGAVATFKHAAPGRAVSAIDLACAMRCRDPHEQTRIGVIGIFVWDVIHGRDPRDAPVEEWGGITYALERARRRAARRLGDRARS